MKNEGYIKLNRSMLSWEWYQDSVTKDLFLHCLLSANWEDKKWQGMTIKRGQFVTTQEGLANVLGTTRQPIRRALTNLQTTNEITIKTTAKYTIITVVNYDKYQATNQVANQQKTNKQPTDQPTTNQQPTKTKELKELKEYKNIKERSARAYTRTREEMAEGDTVVEAYSKLCPNLEPIGVKNYQNAIALLQDAIANNRLTYDQVIQAFKKANSNDFLTGKVNGFIPDFGWMVNPNHILDILSGKYERNYSSSGAKKVKIQKQNYDFDAIKRRNYGGLS